jgi:hypothetical protein
MGRVETLKHAMHGKKTLVLLVAAMSAGMAVLFVLYGYERTWRLWGIPTMTPSFGDFRMITAGAESFRLGHDPFLIDNPSDRWARRINYPRIWGLLFYLGIDQSDTVAAGVILAVLFFSGIFLVIGQIDQRTAWLMACSIFSPAVLLALERGNIDLLMFFLLALAVLAVRKSTPATALLIGSAFVLKLYPIFAVSIFLRKHERLFRNLLLASGAFALTYAAFTIDELRRVRNLTPEPLELSYGVGVLWMRLEHTFAGSLVRVASYAAVLGIAAFSIFHAGRRGAPPPGDPDLHLDTFRVGASIYAGTFLLGANWDYRMIFLLFAIPQLVTWMKNPDRWISRIAAMTLIAAMLALWSLISYRLLEPVPFGIGAYFAIDSLSKWCIFAGLVYLFVSSWPDWIKYRVSRV